MQLKEIKTRAGELVAYSDETGKIHNLSAIYKTDNEGKPTTELLEDIEIIPMTDAEVQEVKARAEAIEAQQSATNYRQDREREYPDFRDYLDGIVKGDQTQINAYISACQAVKAKYPKP